MKSRLLALAAATLTSAALLSACDNSRQPADGSVTKGDAGTAAATGDGTIASTGAAEVGRAEGTPVNRGVDEGMSTSPQGVGASSPPHTAAPGGAATDSPQ
jgi:hypothetical protein